MLLNRKFPCNESTTRNWGLIIGFSLFVTLFLAIFLPFRLSEVPGNRLLPISGYGVITFLVMAFYLFVVKKGFSEQNWTVLKEILFTLLIVLSIGVLNFFYTYAVFDLRDFGINGLLQMIYYTLITAVIPVSFSTIFRQGKLEKKYTSDALAINQDIAVQKTNLVTPTKSLNLKGDYKDTLDVDASAVRYLESKGNYVLIYYKDTDRIQTEKLRSTLSKLYSQLSTESHFFKCHRAFVINLNHIESVSGNAQGLRLHVVDCPTEVPVSRSMVKAFRERYKR